MGVGICDRIQKSSQGTPALHSLVGINEVVKRKLCFQTPHLSLHIHFDQLCCYETYTCIMKKEHVHLEKWRSKEESTSLHKTVCAR